MRANWVCKSQNSCIWNSKPIPTGETHQWVNESQFLKSFEACQQVVHSQKFRFLNFLISVLFPGICRGRVVWTDWCEEPWAEHPADVSVSACEEIPSARWSRENYALSRFSQCGLKQIFEVWFQAALPSALFWLDTARTVHSCRSCYMQWEGIGRRKKIKTTSSAIIKLALNE